FPQMLEDAPGLDLVEDGDREADMDEHIGADTGLGRVGEADLLDDTAEIDARDPHDRVVAGNRQDLTRYGQAHGALPARQAAPPTRPGRAQCRRRWAEPCGANAASSRRRAAPRSPPRRAPR